MSYVDDIQTMVEAAFRTRTLLENARYNHAVREAIRLLNVGELRVAEKTDAGWVTHTWVKEAILLYFAVQKMETISLPPFEWHDKIPIKDEFFSARVRVVPPAVVRYGAHIEAGAVLMPSYVNIGARVGAGTMVDTWATVGSCAQIGKDCHLAGGVGIGGVLEPPAARPVIIEDGVFVGSRCVIVEGVLVETEAVIGAGVILTSNTPIYDVTGEAPVELRGRVPARSVVIPGVRPKKFPAGEFGVPCALIIGQRTAGTDRKVSLNAALRDFGVSALPAPGYHRRLMAGRTFAIGDIHGELDHVFRLFSTFPELDAEDTIVFLGDYVDRGPRSKDVIDYIRNLHTHCKAKIVALRGNHEDAWLKVISNGWPGFVLPPGNGCLATMRSYTGGPFPAEGETANRQEMPIMMAGSFFPMDVVDWLHDLPHFYEDEHAIYVHAGLPKNPDGTWPHPADLPDKTPILWIRTMDFFESYRGKRVVFGHTTTDCLPQELSSYTPDDPTDLWAGENVIGIDTGCGSGGFLTAVELPTGNVYESRHATG